MSESPEAITVPQAIGFWQKNKAWLWPAIMGLAGIIGGANADKVSSVVPSIGVDTTTINAKLDAIQTQLKNCKCSANTPATPPATSGGDGVIHVE